MYSTSVGLLLNGFDILTHALSGEKSMQEEDVPEFVSENGGGKNEKTTRNEKEIQHEKEKTTENPKKNIRNIINGFIGFFDDNSTPM
jgi:hypothetical protein